MPAQTPMNSAGNGFTKPLAGVIATSPATQPEIAPSTLGLPAWAHSTNTHVRPAAAAPKCVATNALDARPDAASALPALNPNQPTHSSPAPIVLITRLWGFIGIVGYPMRLPRYSAHTSAETPLVMCTTVPPAKSKHGIVPPENAFSSPPFPHTMCAIGKYTSRLHSTVNTSIALNLMRSANAPEISAGVMIANIS